MEDYADPSGSESLTELNSTSGSWLTDDLVEFPPFGSEDLIKLGEDLLHVCPIYNKVQYHSRPNEKDIRSISNVISRGKTSPTGLSSVETTALAETFRKVPPPQKKTPFQCLTPLVVRPYPIGFTRVSVRTRGLDF